MPRLPEQVINCAFYLYQTKDDAEQSQNVGGTGFFVAIPSEVSPRHHHVYAVSNWHVVRKLGYSVIRINTLDGRVDIFDIDPGMWTPHAGGDDLAIVPIDLDLSVHKVGLVETVSFADKDAIKNWAIGPGDNVFMVGRFMDHDGGQINNPAVRFGHISVMPSPMKLGTGKMGEAYCVDVHSRSGYSGSPVFVYRTPGEDFTTNNINLTDKFMLFLGTHWGQFPEPWPILGEDKKEEAAKLVLGDDGMYVKGLSGMTCVSPAWNLMELLNMTQFSEQRRKEDALIGASLAKKNDQAEMESSQEC